MDSVTENKRNPHAIELSRERFALLQTQKSEFIEKLNPSLPYEENEELASAYWDVVVVMNGVLLQEARYLVALEESIQKRAL